MKYIENKKLWCVTVTIFYVYYVVNKYIPFAYSNLFAGVGFDGYVLFYAVTLFLFGIVIFCGFGDTEKYVNGYGILEVTRSRKRNMVTKKIVMAQIKNVAFIICISVFIFVIQINIFDKKSEIFNIVDFLSGIGLFGIVSFSLLLWQAFFEIIWDSRIAVLGTLSIISIHLYAGDIMYKNDINEYLNLLFYSNLGIAQRCEQLRISKSLIYLVMGVFCILQVIFIKSVFKKKDIF